MTPAPERLAGFATEERRIALAYRRRAARGVRHSWFSAAHVFQAQEREREVLRLLARHGVTALAELDILEVGCGSGAWLRQLVKWGAAPERLAGIDLQADALRTARRLLPAGIRLECGNAARLPCPDAAFDVVVQATAFSSVIDADMRRAMAAEMLRVLRRRGLVLWYDVRRDNPWNPDVRRIGRRELRQLFPHCRLDLRRITLAPPLARAVARHSWLAAHVLARIPALRTHYLGAIRRGES